MVTENTGLEEKWRVLFEPAGVEVAERPEIWVKGLDIASIQLVAEVVVWVRALRNWVHFLSSRIKAGLGLWGPFSGLLPSRVEGGGSPVHWLQVHSRLWLSSIYGVFPKRHMFQMSTKKHIDSVDEHVKFFWFMVHKKVLQRDCLLCLLKYVSIGWVVWFVGMLCPCQWGGAWLSSLIQLSQTPVVQGRGVSDKESLGEQGRVGPRASGWGWTDMQGPARCSQTCSKIVAPIKGFPHSLLDVIDDDMMSRAPYFPAFGRGWS